MIKDASDLELLQGDIDELVEWSNDWQMLFNEKKCKIMHFEKRKNNVLNTGFIIEEDELGCENDPHNQYFKFTMLNSIG